jgi:uncharacterized coiled-coil DUF342 family protein
MTGQPLRPNASAEQRFRGLLDRRDMEGRKADDARAERDLYQARRRELIEASRGERDRRNALSDEARAHQERAQALRARLEGPRRPLRSRGEKAPETEAEKLARLDAEIAQAEHRLETTPMPLKEEKELVELARRKKRDADKLRAKVAATAPAPEVDAQGLPTDPEALRRELDLEMQQVTVLREQAQAAHEAAQQHSTEIDALTKDADQKHKEYLEYRARADEIHEKAMKMRELVIAERAKRRAEQDEAQASLKEQAEKVRLTLYDEEKIEKEAEDAVAALRQKGKLSL